MPIAEDNGIGRVAHRQHHCKGDAHGDRDQSVERVDVQSFRLEEKARECQQIMVCLVLCVLSWQTHTTCWHCHITTLQGTLWWLTQWVHTYCWCYLQTWNLKYH